MKKHVPFLVSALTLFCLALLVLFSTLSICIHLEEFTEYQTLDSRPWDKIDPLTTVPKLLEEGWQLDSIVFDGCCTTTVTVKRQRWRIKP